MSRDSERLEFFSLHTQLLTEVEESEYSLFIFTFIRRLTSISLLYWIYLIILLTLFVMTILSFLKISPDSRELLVAILGAASFQLVFGSSLHQLTQLLFFRLHQKVRFKVGFSLKRLSLIISYPEHVFYEKGIRLSYLGSFAFTSVIPFIFGIMLEGQTGLALIVFALFQTLYCMKDIAILSYFKFKQASGFMYARNGKNLLIFRKKHPMSLDKA